jgi:hypothetical protein
MAQQFSGAPYLNSYGVQDRYGYNGEVAPDVAIDQQALNRKQQIANLLLQQGLQGAGTGQMVGRFYVPTSGTQHAAKIGELLAGLAGTHMVDKKRDALSTDMNEERARAVQRYIDETQGKQVPERTLPQGTPDQTIPVQGPPNLVQPNMEDSGTSQGLQEVPPSITIPGTPPTQGPVNEAQFQAPDPNASRQAVMQAMSHADPRVREAVRFMEQAKAHEEEKKAAQAFQAQQADENRAVRREGIEANALTRVEQMRNTMQLTQMQIDARMQAGQDANALKKQLADQAADLKKLELQTKRETVQQGKTPPGYRMTTDGNLEAIPGGPADTKLQGAFNQDTAMLQNSNAGFDRLAASANDILNHPGLAGITGLRGKVPDVPGTDAANARALLNTLKSQVGFGVLQEMRNNSKTGGALGAVSDAEGKRLENNLAALDTTQDIEQFKKQLKSIIDYTDQAKGRLRDTFNMKHKSGEPVPMTPSTQGPKAGTVDGGYRFKGGDPGKAENWEKAN